MNPLKLYRVTTLLLGFAATGCYTTKNVVTVAPLDTKFPVSATEQYVDGSGSVVEASAYKVVKPFEFEKTISAPRHSTTESRMAIEGELARLVEEGSGDAVTDLRIEGVSYDPGSTYTSAFWKRMGWGFGCTGGAVMAIDLSDGKPEPALLAVGGVMAGIGVLGFVFGAIADDPAEWKFKVSGHVVKRGEGGIGMASTSGATASAEK